MAQPIEIATIHATFNSFSCIYLRCIEREGNIYWWLSVPRRIYNIISWKWSFNLIWWQCKLIEFQHVYQRNELELSAGRLWLLECFDFILHASTPILELACLTIPHHAWKHTGSLTIKFLVNEIISFCEFTDIYIRIKYNLLMLHFNSYSDLPP